MTAEAALRELESLGIELTIREGLLCYPNPQEPDPCEAEEGPR